jgi:hypothetical protein
VLATAGQVWVAAGLGWVIGITPSQSARSTLVVGVPVSFNTAQFLGHLAEYDQHGRSIGESLSR